MKIKLGNWLYNAGIVGFLRILETIDKKEVERIIESGEDCFEFKEKYLEHFAKAYCLYVLRRKNIFEMAFSPDKKKGVKKEDKFFTSFYEYQRVKEIASNRNDILISKLSPTLDLKSIQKIIEVEISEHFLTLKNLVQKDILELESQIELEEEKPKLKLLKQRKRKLESGLKKYSEDWNSIKLKTVEKHLSFYSVFNFLSQFYKNQKVIGQADIKGFTNRVDAFQELFINSLSPKNTTQESLFESEKNKFTCKFCKQCKISDSKSIFQETTFSITGVSGESFANFFFNFNSDLFLCGQCKLIIFCIWAGLNEKHFQLKDSDDSDLVFVNLPSLRDLWNSNKELENRFSITKQSEKESTIYEEIMKNLLTKYQEKRSSWVLGNIDFIELKPIYNKAQGKPVFKNYSLSKGQAQLFNKSSVVKNLNELSGQVELIKGKSFWLKNEVVKAILRSQNLNKLTYLTLVQTLENKQNSWNALRISVISANRKNIYNKLSGEKFMDSQQISDELRKFNLAGFHFAKCESELKKRQNKAHGMIQLIKSGKYNEFYERVLKLCIAYDRNVPKILINVLNPSYEIDFESMAYAFMSGYLGEVKKDEQNKTEGNN